MFLWCIKNLNLKQVTLLFQNNDNNGYMCVCNPGYSGQNCGVNTNECSSNPCQNGGTCTDRVNGFTCQCSSGYTGDTCDEPTSG